MTGQTLAEVLAEPIYREWGDMVDRRYLIDAIVPAVTAHLAAILADPETVEAVMDAICDSQGGDYVSMDDARAAIAVIAERLGLA